MTAPREAEALARQMDQREQTYLDEIRETMQSYDWQLDAVVTFTHGIGIQVYLRNNAPTSRGRRKVGPILFPSEGKTLADLLATLGEMTVKEPEQHEHVPYLTKTGVFCTVCDVRMENSS